MSPTLDSASGVQRFYAIKLGDGTFYGGTGIWTSPRRESAANYARELAEPLEYLGIPRDLYPQVVEVVETIAWEVAADDNPSA
jgi:hypothetical protein